MSSDDRDEQMRLRVQSLLAERFQLKVSFVKKELPVYDLVVAKGGLKCAKIESVNPFCEGAAASVWMEYFYHRRRLRLRRRYGARAYTG